MKKGRGLIGRRVIWKECECFVKRVKASMLTLRAGALTVSVPRSAVKFVRRTYVTTTQ